MPNESTTKEDPMVPPLVEFGMLLHFHRQNDFKRAAEAQANLERLGVRVKILRGAKLQPAKVVRRERARR